jgi:hypothetical protein
MVADFFGQLGAMLARSSDAAGEGEENEQQTTKRKKIK